MVELREIGFFVEFDYYDGSDTQAVSSVKQSRKTIAGGVTSILVWELRGGGCWPTLRRAPRRQERHALGSMRSLCVVLHTGVPVVPRVSVGVLLITNIANEM